MATYGISREGVDALKQLATDMSSLNWVPIGICAAVSVTGIALAIAGNSKAKSAAEKKYSTVTEFTKYHDDAKSGQSMRTAGFALAILGAAGIGLSFAF